MAFQFHERPVSRNSSGGSDPRIIYNFVATGSNDDQYVTAFAKSATPLVVSTTYGLLYRQDIALQSGGHEIYYVDVSYGKLKRENGSYTFSFSTMGGTVHQSVSLGTVASYGAPGAPLPIPKNDGAIGVVDGDNVAGCEVVIPTLKLTVSFTHPLGVVTLSHIKALHDITGFVNDRPFLGFDEGEVLFLGASGSDGSQSEATVQYDFGVSPTARNFTVGGMTIPEKKGWDYMWIKFSSATDAGQAVRKPRYAYIERVYKRADLATVLGFG